MGLARPVCAQDQIRDQVVYWDGSPPGERDWNKASIFKASPPPRTLGAGRRKGTELVAPKALGAVGSRKGFLPRISWKGPAVRAGLTAGLGGESWSIARTGIGKPPRPQRGFRIRAAVNGPVQFQDIRMAWERGGQLEGASA